MEVVGCGEGWRCEEWEEVEWGKRTREGSKIDVDEDGGRKGVCGGGREGICGGGMKGVLRCERNGVCGGNSTVEYGNGADPSSDIGRELVVYVRPPDNLRVHTRLLCCRLVQGLGELSLCHHLPL
ncbi:hypothetical protein Pmani_003113 [Petrolisthes manimaculis]|uniref:Uncharacterized protein n=1 Tax=Petrolisthes manimaculis TaxID=1843537 RepID=A0AAE1QJN8_9EUCA|nr:hypothetical protein Pmani_003113 [Petrolisthes manimaculis]